MALSYQAPEANTMITGNLSKGIQRACVGVAGPAYDTRELGIRKLREIPPSLSLESNVFCSIPKLGGIKVLLLVK